jgi:hypothetical protein
MSVQIEKFLTTNVIDASDQSNEHRRKTGIYWFLTWIHKDDASQETLEEVATKLSEYKNISNFIIQMEEDPITLKSHIHMALGLTSTSHRPVAFFDRTFPGVHIQYAQNIDAVRLYCCKPYTRQLPPIFFNKKGVSIDKYLDKEQYLKRAEEFNSEAKCNIKQTSTQLKIIKAREKEIEKVHIKIATADIIEESKNYIADRKRYIKAIVDLEIKLEIKPGKKSKLKKEDRALAIQKKVNYEKSLSELELTQPISSISHNPSDKIRELQDEVLTLKERVTKLEKLISTLILESLSSPTPPPNFEDIEFEPNSPTPPGLEHRNLSPKSIQKLASKKYGEARSDGISHNDATKITLAIRNGTAIPVFPIKPPIKNKYKENNSD